MRLSYAILVAAALAGCADNMHKEEQEAAKNTYVCLLDSERVVIRFDMGMARMLMPSGERIDLYQIPAPAGVRFSNGNLELRGKGIELTLSDATTGTAVALSQCAPYSTPKP